MKEKQRIEIVQRLGRGELTLSEVSKLLCCSERTVFRHQARLGSNGLVGLIHGNKGKRSWNRVSDEQRAKIVAVVKARYADVNDTHLRELLASREGIGVGRETLRGLLRAAGVKAKHQRRRGKHRTRRERKAAMGMMLQVDASLHRWFEDRGGYLTLVGAKDDSTGHVWARFADAETTWAYLDLMEDVLASHGVPLSLYSDRHSIFHTPRDATIVEQLKDIQPLTQFGRAMDDVGITIIKAWSPQAKGRIEREWGTLQDRLVVELRLAGINTKEAANVFLKAFLVRHNAQFTVPPADTRHVFRKAPPADQRARILCPKQVRKVNNDHTVSFDGIAFQIPPSKKFRSIAKQDVTILQLRDGTLEIVYRAWTVATFSNEAVARMIARNTNAKTDLKAAA